MPSPHDLGDLNVTNQNKQNRQTYNKDNFPTMHATPFGKVITYPPHFCVEVIHFQIP
jgi:hypothetical protein